MNDRQPGQEVFSMNTQSKLNIGVLGSCRVHNPIKEMDDCGMARYIGSAPIRFLHNPMEMVQALHVLQGNHEVSANLMPLSGQARKIDDSRVFHRCLGLSDVVVCEISSVRIAEFKGHQLQINLLRNFFIDAGLSQEALSSLYPAGGLTAAKKISERHLTDPLALDILKEGAFYEMSPDQIEDSLVDIMRLIGRPVMFVGIVEKLEDGSSIKQRAAVHAAISEFVKGRPNVDFFNPSDLIPKYGFQTVVRDMGHYQDDFVPTVGEELLDRVVKFEAGLSAG
jgi:hypothetical protein